MGSPPGHLLIAIAERYDYMQNTDVRAALVEQRSSRDWPNMGASLRDLQSLAEVAFRFFVSVTFRRPGWIEYSDINKAAVSLSKIPRLMPRSAQPDARGNVLLRHNGIEA